MSDSVVAKKLQSMSTRALFLIIRIKTGCCVLFSQSKQRIHFNLSTQCISRKSTEYVIKAV